MDDGFAQFEHDHREIEEQFQLVGDGDGPVVRELCERLTRHSTVEEAVLHPALRRWVDGGDDLADRAQQEHATIATMVAELSDSATPERVGDLVIQLHSAVTAHLAFVDSQIIPEMRDVGAQPSAVEP
jgi:hemerythrin superfamily protein